MRKLALPSTRMVTTPSSPSIFSTSRKLTLHTRRATARATPTPTLGTDPAVADTDGDGRIDGQDACPFDPADDSDGDGSCDSVDACPLDPDDDADNDGVCGDVDLCLGADRTGDRDHDGICTDRDVCPDDPEDKLISGVCVSDLEVAPVDDQGGCRFSVVGSPAPFAAALFPLTLVLLRRRKEV